MWRLGLGARAGAASGGPSPSRPKRVPFVQQARQLPHSIGPNDASAGSIARAVPAFGRTKGEKKVKLASTLMAAVTALAASACAALAIDLSGAGATFPYPIYAKWADAYKKETGVGLNYQSIGSGGGIKQIQNKTVTFGATDMPLKPEELKKVGLVQFPTVIGGDVPVVNLEGVKSADLRLDGDTLAKIFLGQITKWDDPAIRKLNPNAKLPSQAIVVVHRSDGSGTTFIWTDYLSKVSADWKSKVGANTSVEWPIGIGAKGNEGVANNVANTKGSIGYVEYAYAKQNKLTTVGMINKDGKTVAANAASFQAAAANADWEKSDGFYVILTDEPGAESWPIAGATFILLYKQPQDPVAAGEALKFFAWAYAKGDKMAEDLDYVPMPDRVVNAIQKVWASEVKDANGRPLFALSN
jgi:phosphate transport system substrate-binding protein